MTPNDILENLYDNPVGIAHMIGFDKLTDLHNKWITDILTNINDQTLQAHRGSYKTTCVTLAIAILMITQPNKKLLFVRKTDTDVKEVVRQIVKILKTDEMRAITKIIYGIPVELISNTQNELNTNLNRSISGTSQLTAQGINGSLTGKHFDYIFTDDIVNVEDRTSKAEREHTKLIYQELQNIKNRGGRFINTGTPWHKEDCFALMSNITRYDCYTTGLITDEEIKSLKSTMAPSLFAANYELRHIASEDVIFDNPKWLDESYRVEQGICHIDCAYGGEDYTAFTIINRVDDKYYVFGKLWRKHVDDVLDMIIGFRKHYNAGKIYNETNGDKGFLDKELNEKGERTEPYRENENKYIKIVTYLKKNWENVYFINETDKEYVEQICDYNENAEHDDAPDSLASALRVLEYRGQTFSFE